MQNIMEPSTEPGTSTQENVGNGGTPMQPPVPSPHPSSNAGISETPMQPPILSPHPSSKAGNGETPMQPPVQGSHPSSNPATKAVFSRPVYHNSRHKKPVVIQMCEICNIELTGQVVIDAHMKGSKHAKKLKARELLSHLVFKCDICNVPLNSSQQLEVHNAGAKHIEKVKEKYQSLGGTATLTNEPTADGTIDAQGSGVKADKPKSVASPLDLFCTVCNVTVNSPQQLEQHLSSKKHKDRETGRAPQRPGPYQRTSQGARGGRGGLGSHGPPARGGKSASGKYASLSASFKSAGYSNSFIKPEGGVILPSNCGTNRGPSEPHHHAPSHGNKTFNMGGQFKNRGSFGSLTPYISTDTTRGGHSARAGADVPYQSHATWTNPAPTYGGYSYDYGYGYNYSGYENADGYAEGYAEGYTDYGMMQHGQHGQPGPSPSY